ncbi:MAG: hypothetical protein ACRDM1_10970 [Gaiellaceae bacterium]
MLGRRAAVSASILVVAAGGAGVALGATHGSSKSQGPQAGTAPKRTVPAQRPRVHRMCPTMHASAGIDPQL